MKVDALIVGAGPAGATTALLLARAGWSVAIVEKKEFPRRKVCGEFISATSLPLLGDLGIADFYLARGGPEVRRVGLFAADTVLASAMPQAWRSLGRWGRALGREHLDLALLDTAVRAGARLWQPFSADALRREQDSYVCTLVARDRVEEVSARIVVLAHGSWERGVGPPHVDPAPAVHKPSDLLAFKAHFRGTGLAADLMPLMAFPGGYGGLVHSDDGRVTLSCCIRRDVLRESRDRHRTPHAGEAVLRHIMATCLGAREVLGRARRDGAWLATGPIRPGIRRRHAAGVFCVGNIAGEAHPIVAEGISMAMQSAWLLARELTQRQDAVVAGRQLPDAGRDYARQWTAWFAPRLHAASAFAQIAMRPGAVALLLPLFRQFPGILTFGAQLSGKTRQVVPAALASGEHH